MRVCVCVGGGGEGGGGAEREGRFPFIVHRAIDLFNVDETQMLAGQELH